MKNFNHPQFANSAFEKKVNGKKVPDDYCDACGKKVADIECGHGVMCEECYIQAHGSADAVCEAV